MSKRSTLTIVPRGVPGAVATAPAGNLPAQHTLLVGRERETAEVRALLRRDDIRLLTLIGPPGVGKTRLALRVAEEMLDDFGDGVYFVPLAPISDPDLVAQAIARALDMRDLAGAPFEEKLKERLQGEELLLILDNFEQVVPAAQLVSDLLRADPGLKVLVTSRVALHVYGEQEFPVPTLEVPGSRFQVPGPKSRVQSKGREPGARTLELGTIDSVALFVQRARLVKPSFALTEANAEAVAQVCIKLDGLPLTIELAAARIKFLSPQALLSRLEHRLEVLRDGPVDLPPRQQTLRNAIAWSYDLLDEDEQWLFRGLSIFVGGCSLEAVDAVLGAGDQGSEIGVVDKPVAGSRSMVATIDRLASLVDKSLLRQEETEGGEARFWMLETIREYASEQLRTRGEEEEVGRRHAAHYLAVAHHAASQFTGPHPRLWFDKLEDDLGNLRAAINWLLDHGQAEEVARLIEPLVAFCAGEGHVTEGIQWLEAALEADGEMDPAVRAKASIMGSYLAYINGDYERSRRHCESALAVGKATGDRTSTAQALHGLGAVELSLGEYEKSHALFTETLALHEETGDKGGMARILNDLGELALRREAWDEAEQYFERCIALFRELGWRGGVSITLSNLGEVKRYQGLWQEAEEFYRQSLQLTIELGTHASTIYVLEGLAAVALGRAWPLRAARLLGAAEQRREVVRRPIDPDRRAEYERTLTAIRDMLGEEEFVTAWEEGREMTSDEAIAYALEPPSLEESRQESRRSLPGVAGRPRDGAGTGLTRREREIVALIAQGRSNSQIAALLVLSQRTVETHITHVLSKLGYASRGEIAAWAFQSGFMDALSG